MTKHIHKSRPNAIDVLSQGLSHRPAMAAVLAATVKRIDALPADEQARIAEQLGRNPELAVELTFDNLSKPMGQDIVPDDQLASHVVSTKATGERKAVALSTYRLPDASRVDTAEVRYLREHVDVSEYTHATPVNARQLAKLIRDHDGPLDGVYCFLEPVDEQVIDAAAEKGVKWIASSGTGHDNKNKKYAAEKGIQLTNAPGALMHATSEAAITHTLNIVTNMSQWITETERGQQVGCSMQKGRHDSLQGKTVAIVGFGQVGFEAARRLTQFLPNKEGEGAILYVDPNTVMKDEKEAALNDSLVAASEALRIAHPNDEITPPAPVRGVGLDEALRKADIVILTPALVKASDLTPDAIAAGATPTEGMIGASQLAIMKDGAFLVNTARGPIVDEQAVADALRAGRIHYGTDVLVNEWERPSHLYAAAREGGALLYVSEHVASNDGKTRDVLMAGRMLANSIELTEGRAPLNPINNPQKS
ncbi:MAG: 2-hydroxyacid dehydrogenase [Candidatus Altiarchaeota archaeon]